MRSIQEIKKELAELETAHTKLDKEGSEYKKLSKRAAFLRQCILYLECNPTTESIQRQLAEVGRRLKFIEDGYEDWLRITDVQGIKNPLTHYNGLMEKRKVRLQINALKFLQAA